jgi:hypothetical protein
VGVESGELRVESEPPAPAKKPKKIPKGLDKYDLLVHNF